VPANAGAIVGLSASTRRYFAVAVIRPQFGRLRVRSVITAVFFAFVAVAATPSISLADEDGISFWIPGFFGSLAAAPQQPGWSLASIYYHTSVSASGNAAVAREITIGQLNPKINVSVSAHVSTNADLGIVAPSYTFATSFLGGQATAYLLGLYGSNSTSLDGPVSGTVGPFPFSRSSRATLSLAI
jgi:hypothetical protein